MNNEDAVIHPLTGNKPTRLGHRCIMAATEPDLKQIHRLLDKGNSRSRRIYMSRLHYGYADDPALSIVGPFIGAPYAALLLESMIAWGVREVLVFGWCGSISENVKIGDIIIPERSLIDDGTSKNYTVGTCDASLPCPSIQAALKKQLAEHHIAFHEGPVWSTDAVFRETKEKIRYYQKENTLGVEMETAALFSVGGFRKIDVGCLLLVSDELFSLKWKPGFKDPIFKQRRHQICEIISHYR